MNLWYMEFDHANPNAQPPPPPPIPQPTLVAYQVVEVVRREKPLVDRIQKQGAEEFRASKDDDPERSKFWLENIIRVFDKLSCTPEECMKCVVSFLRDSAYQWWNTLVSVVPRERITWEFFQEEFRKKYISQRFIDQKRKEFIELKQGKMTLTEYEREFVRLMDSACKAEELVKEKRKVEMESHNSRKRQMNKSFQSSSKKSRDFPTRSATLAGFSNRSKSKQYSRIKAQTTSVATVGNTWPNRSECPQCGRRHPSECRAQERAYFKCGSQDHFIRKCPEMVEKKKIQC
ncbi:maturase K [Gossypium australe]|uniref:Maturase K n=1 Tax=Gossypium australe TaxID=47621 RepID=A0A5B6UXE1_9ROSI|nr:maturase K [Gossypium australe]